MADKELLSALMDGETVDKALISKLEQEPESQKTWQNYHLIGDVMRGEAPETVSWNIADSVAAALENEPNYTQVTTPLVESQPTPAQARRKLPAWLTQLGQVAVAASVSLAVIVGVQQYGGDSGQSQSEQLPVLQTIPLSGNVEPVSLTRETVSPKAYQQTHRDEAKVLEQRRRINALLQDYELQLRLTTDTKAQKTEHLQPVVE
ncbi:anti-sigma E factor [Vibrio albus]|jgi:sigma-E factor negative regulatory protein RseA|uniref:Anti-sigma-E factor RseA n=1 Tax=Vibrio albus TaxID=2200953 RepID=A0A2U3BCZ0_9VIBR|nr:RseA family anti-sigma factor [Vibrio albus]PWI34625.1 anti-sigma E factor [Vibrio albus]